MNTTATPLLPDVSTPLNAPFWSAARQHRFAMPRCAGCGELNWPPKPVCPECLRPLSPEDWTEIPGGGEIWSFVVYHRPFHPNFAQAVPYNVAFIKLDAGPIFVSNVLGSNDLTIGQRVEACFDDVTPEVTLVKFRRV